ncbi:MAG: hypothetical protein AB7D36_06370 [Oscillospiraceae bacterium]
MQKMKNYAQRLCVAICVLSAFGFMARWIQNISIFEKDTGLAIEGASSSIFLVLFSIATIGGFIAMTLPLLHLGVGDYPAGDVRGDNTLYKVVTSICALMMLAGGTLMMLKSGEELYPQLRRILGLLAVVSALGMYYIGRTGKNGADSALACLGTIVPVLFGCFWLIVSYKDHASNPVIWSYAVEIIAIACATEALYLIAGFVFGRPRIVPAVAVNAFAAFFCFMELGDDRGFAFQICFAALGLFFVVTVYTLVSGLSPERRRFNHLKNES